MATPSSHLRPSSVRSRRRDGGVLDARLATLWAAPPQCCPFPGILIVLILKTSGLGCNQHRIVGSPQRTRMRFCTAADFFAFVSALFASSFASSFAFAALIVNSFAVSSASKDSWRKFLHATRSRGIYHVRKYSNTL